MFCPEHSLLSCLWDLLLLCYRPRRSLTLHFLPAAVFVQLPKHLSEAWLDFHGTLDLFCSIFIPRIITVEPNKLFSSPVECINFLFTQQPKNNRIQNFLILQSYSTEHYGCWFVIVSLTSAKVLGIWGRLNNGPLFLYKAKLPLQM